MNVLVSLAAVLALVLLAWLGASAGLTVLLAVVLPYAALALFAFGVTLRLAAWARSPVPFRIPTTCGQQKSHAWIRASRFENPHDRLGVMARMALEILGFRSLLRNTRTAIKGERVVHASTAWLWALGIAFHYAFLAIFLRHLRFFAEPVPGFVAALQKLDGFLQIGTPVLYLSSALFLAAALFLFLRRIASPRLRYLSLPADYFPLFLVLGIAATGVLLRHFVKTDIVGVKEMAISLVRFRPIAPPESVDALFYIHFFLVTVLFGYFPWSKMMHAAGIFLSPTRNLANDSRAMRHVNPWNAPAKPYPYEAYEAEFRDKMIEAGLPVERKE